MKKILFVCLGNICRSSTAEGVMLHLLKEAGLEKEFVASNHKESHLQSVGQVGDGSSFNR